VHERRTWRESVSLMNGEVYSSILSGNHFRSILIADRYCSRHADTMGRDSAERTAPNLFSTGAVKGGSSATPTKLPAAGATTETALPRHVLPKNLPNAIKHLSDGELDFLHAATFEEMKRRGRMPPRVETDLPARPDLTKIQSPPTKTAKLNAAEVSLTRGQVNAVRSAFKAGITPSRIAREFGIPLSDVRQALASDETKR
jgi:hypothetical protein